MVWKILFLMSVVAGAGCSQTVRTAKFGEHTVLEVVDDGVWARLNSSQLHRDWDDAALKICPRGYTLINQQYRKEEAFMPARLEGALICR